MPQAEYEPFFISPEPIPEAFLQQGRQKLGYQTLKNFTLLGEIDTSYDEERAYLREHIIGQDQAIEAIITALDRQHTRALDDHRPIASLAFLGPTGVGKTEAAKALSVILAENRISNLLKIDCANYSQGYEVSSLLGSPPGYVGREQRPQLSQERITKGTVVLFDEIEKGASQLHNVMLDIMDTGVLELHSGQKNKKNVVKTKVSFRDTIVIMTSNLGAREMAREASGYRIGYGSEERTPSYSELEEVALKKFKEYFVPEFSNRIDNMVVFHPHTEESMYKILDGKLKAMNDRYVDNYGAFINLSEGTRSFLVNKALEEPEYGARPLVRALEANVAAYFGRYTANQKIPNGSEIQVYHRDEVADYIDETYKNELVFAIRSNTKYQKRIKLKSTAIELFRPPVENTVILKTHSEESMAPPEDPYDPDPTIPPDPNYL